MTLVKLNTGKRNDNNSNENSYPGLPLLFNSWFSSRVPSMFDTDSLLQDFFDNEPRTLRNIGTSLPAVNISETDNALEIEVAAPGMNKKNFKIEVNGTQLRISYNRETSSEEGTNKEPANTWRREFNFESFERSFTLPEMIDGEKLSASYEDGILKLVIPKKEEAKKKPARMIEVK